VADPDGFVCGAQWMPAARAAQLLKAQPFAFTALLAAARVSAAPQAAARLWQLRRQPGDEPSQRRSVGIYCR
jgi:hypothetical protein